MTEAQESHFEIEGMEELGRPRSQDSSPGAPGGPARRPPSEPPPPEPPHRFWAWTPLALLVLGAAAVLFTQRSIGYAWDEAYYYDPSLKAVAWLGGVADGSIPLGEKGIDAYWEERHEHPSFHKLLTGFSLSLFETRLGALTAMRLPAAWLFGASLGLIFYLGRMAWGPWPALAAALAYAAMPRVFGHAHFSSMETPLVFAMLLTIYCFLRGLESPGWSVATGLALGLLLATKINGFFLIPPLVLWGHLYARRRYVNNLFAMIFLAPLVFLALWPWLWPDPVGRTLDYLAFHATHQQTALYFLGKRFGYGEQLAPWFYPSVMVGVTLPVTVLILGAVGLAGAIAGVRRRPLAALYLMIAGVTWAVASAPGTPKYDGVRLFLPLFAFLALFAGGGAAALTATVARYVFKGAGELRAPGRAARYVAPAICALLAIEGAVATARYHPHLLSYFNPLVGGLRGAERHGFEVTYWGEAVNEQVIATLNDPEILPPGASVKLLALHKMNFDHLQRWGTLRRDLRFDVPAPGRGYDAHLLQMRRGFFARPERALAEGDRFAALARWDFRGVPMLGLYSTGPEFEDYWRGLGAEPDAPAEPGSILQAQ